MALHAKKQIVATAGDDCTWKIWNLENNENIMTGEGHKSWICAIDFHPAGSHLITGGGDKSIKVWDFINSSIAHTFVDVHTGPVWKLKFHERLNEFGKISHKSKYDCFSSFLLKMFSFM